MQDNQNLKEKRLSSKQLYDGKIVKLFLDEVSLPNGKLACREVVRHPGAVCVVPLTENNEVLCVKQFRYPFSEITLEIPAGKLDSPDEDHRKAALRELREETGATTDDLTFIGKLYSSPAILDEVIYMYLAKNLSYGDTDPDDDEFIEPERIPLDTMVRLILAGSVPDAKTQTAVLKAYLLSKPTV